MNPEKRPRVKMVPLYKVEWTGVFENYSRKFVNRHFWRVQHVLGSKEDALQECAAQFAWCYRQYCYKVDNDAWFMRLFQMTLSCAWHDLSRKDSRMRTTVPPDAVDRVEHSIGSLAISYADASSELKMVLKLIADAPAELLEFLFEPRKPELVNRRLCRTAGIRTGTVDVCGELRELLKV